MWGLSTKLPGRKKAVKLALTCCKRKSRCSANGSYCKGNGVPFLLSLVFPFLDKRRREKCTSSSTGFPFWASEVWQTLKVWNDGEKLAGFSFWAIDVWKTLMGEESWRQSYYSRSSELSSWFGSRVNQAHWPQPGFAITFVQ